MERQRLLVATLFSLAVASAAPALAQDSQTQPAQTAATVNCPMAGAGMGTMHGGPTGQQGMMMNGPQSQQMMQTMQQMRTEMKQMHQEMMQMRREMRQRKG